VGAAAKIQSIWRGFSTRRHLRCGSSCIRLQAYIRCLRAEAVLGKKMLLWGEGDAHMPYSDRDTNMQTTANGDVHRRSGGKDAHMQFSDDDAHRRSSDRDARAQFSDEDAHRRSVQAVKTRSKVDRDKAKSHDIRRENVYKHHSECEDESLEGLDTLISASQKRPHVSGGTKNRDPLHVNTGKSLNRERTSAIHIVTESMAQERGTRNTTCNTDKSKTNNKSSLSHESDSVMDLVTVTTTASHNAHDSTQELDLHLPARRRQANVPKKNSETPAGHNVHDSFDQTAIWADTAHQRRSNKKQKGVPDLSPIRLDSTDGTAYKQHIFSPSTHRSSEKQNGLELSPIRMRSLGNSHHQDLLSSSMRRSPEKKDVLDLSPTRMRPPGTGRQAEKISSSQSAIRPKVRRENDRDKNVANGGGDDDAVSESLSANLDGLPSPDVFVRGSDDSLGQTEEVDVSIYVCLCVRMCVHVCL
jgi:hypothetical protein